MFIYSDDLEKMKILDSIKIGEKFSDNAIYNFFQANKDSRGEISVEKIGKLLKKL